MPAQKGTCVHVHACAWTHPVLVDDIDDDGDLALVVTRVDEDQSADLNIPLVNPRPRSKRTVADVSGRFKKGVLFASWQTTAPRLGGSDCSLGVKCSWLMAASWIHRTALERHFFIISLERHSKDTSSSFHSVKVSLLLLLKYCDRLARGGVARVPLWIIRPHY